ncbi:hypothetical protein [Texcoconibacillus texcoconensis]|uniref:Small, acid-soluble spore protein N n=1 Tax=Texcoconibacillus texcoconensis TaxID=1095777 RepID=A0A840QT22_9BACI|nr:hypothetical protein [Texcoconibacillus texcoconensis]MBB5174458.1 hypothetical protein [Texcoconibacillus texcoconensis]
MPFDKNKQQAFQAAQQAFVEAQHATEDLHYEDVDYGHEHKLAQQEINEAFQVIEKAHITATEHQKEQLRAYEKELERMRQLLQD